MLLANIAKSSSIERLITLKRSKVPDLSQSELAITQLIELFNRGANGSYNKHATYEYLAYLFADLAKVRHPIVALKQRQFVNQPSSPPL